MTRHPLTDRARSLRVDQTDVERSLWNRLRNHRLGGWKWKRLVPRGSYIVDFLCAEARLVIELDGGQHAEAVTYDARRTAFLESLGLSVMRFWNVELVENLDGVCETILLACHDRAQSRTLAPLAGRGQGEGPIRVTESFGKSSGG
jgi:very-short-patch-repair endonuclease